MRLIDADALTKEIKIDIEDVGLQERMIFHRINDAPTIDAVPVVRCKDCKWYPDGTDVCQYLGWDDDFCSFGERREP